MSKQGNQVQAQLSPIILAPLEESTLNQIEDQSPDRSINKRSQQLKKAKFVIEKKQKTIKIATSTQKTPPKIPHTSKLKEKNTLKLPSFSVYKITQKKGSLQNTLENPSQEFFSMHEVNSSDVRLSQQIEESNNKIARIINKRPSSTIKKPIPNPFITEKDNMNSEYKYYFQKLGISLLSDVAKTLQKSILQEKRQLEFEEKLEEFNTHSQKVSKRRSRKNVSQNDQQQNQNVEQIQKTQDQIKTRSRIKILNEPLNNHTNHPINKTIRQINQFCNLTFVKANQNVLPKNLKYDNQSIINQAKSLGIELPKNTPLNSNLFKQKNFIVYCKEVLLKKLYQTINDSNQVQLQFERSCFQFYKCFVGRGNNAPLIINVFKNNRWWWNVYQTLPYNQDGEQILPQSTIYGQNNNFNLYKEDFREHNLIWTQWKKLRHFHYLKPPQPKLPDYSQTKEDECDSKRKEAKKPSQLSNLNTTLGQEQIKSNNMSNDIKVYNKLENNFHLSNKCALFYNMKRYYEAINKDPFDVIPLTFHVKQGLDDQEFIKFQLLYKEVERQILQSQQENEEQQMESLLPSLNKKQKKKKERFKNSSKKEGFIKENELSKSRKNNSFYQSPIGDDKTHRHGRNSRLRINKSKDELMEASQLQMMNRRKENQRISKNFSQGQILKNLNPTMLQTASQLPKIFNNSQQQYMQNQLSFLSNELVEGLKQNSKNIWIIKPGENTNRGNGINVTSNLSEIKNIVNQSSYDLHRTFIIQKYLENPTLFKGRKFDIRCFGMLTSINGHLKGYIYDDGYIRTSSRDYNVKKLNNKLIHLTNDAIQKKSDDYGKYEAGNKVSFKEYQQFLDEVYPNLQIDFIRDIFSQIKRIIVDTFRATYQQIDPNQRQHTFEIYGYDFMLDSNFKVYLIEVNTNPCIETGCQILQKQIPDMIDSGLRLAIDPLFPPPNFHKRMNTQVPVTLWELGFDSDIDKFELDMIFEKYDNQKGMEQQVKDYEAELIKEEDQEDEFD